MKPDKIEKYRQYIKTGRSQLLVEEAKRIVEEYESNMKKVNSSNVNSSNVNSSNVNSSNDNLKSPKKVLIIVDFDLSLSAGNTIWCCNFINSYLNDGLDVNLLTTNHNKQTEIFKKNLNKEINIYHESSIYNFIERKIYDKIIIRHDSFISGLKINESWINKVTLYIINEKVIPNKYQGKIITQSDKLKRKIMERNINEKQIEIKEPEGYNYNFNLPERTDNEIRLIYCGTLRDEENILEIIDEFKKIHKERPEVLLKIVYGKIHGDKKFTNKMNQIIKEGVEGITFKHNLSHRDACYEIATSDIGICWRKNGWGDNGEVSTKVKEYEIYGISILINDFKIKLNTNTIYFDDKITNIILNYCKGNSIIKGNFKVIYMSNTTFLNISGYTIRTQCILNELNKLLASVDGDFIRVNHVDEQVGFNREFNVFELQSALAKRNFNKSIQIAHQMAKNSDKGEMLRTSAVLNSYFSKIMSLHALKSFAKHDVASFLGVNPYFVDEYLTAQRNFPMIDLEWVMNQLKYFDLRLKGINKGDASDGDLLVETVVSILNGRMK